ncbi:MAG: C39 family peptidase [Oscillospiraceae bacterium]|nr:C39 family peptidase [Oscillospiraceae bacterium]
MKQNFFKKLAAIITAAMLLATLAACSTSPAATAEPNSTPANVQPTQAGNFTDEMKIPKATDLSPADGAESIERDGDHQNSPYFNRYDFYNSTSTDSLTILPKFKTYQQSSEWSCGVASALMVLEYYGKLGDYNEATLAEFRTADAAGTLPAGTEAGATSLRQMIEIFDGVGGFDSYSTFDCKDTVYDMFNLEYVQTQLKEGTPIMVGWNDWGGHWQVIIGYDTMGTDIESDDVIIVADPYDTTDHNQDGYGVYGAQRFIYNFTFYNFFAEDELNDMVFLISKPEGTE